AGRAGELQRGLRLVAGGVGDRRLGDRDRVRGEEVLRAGAGGAVASMIVPGDVAHARGPPWPSPGCIARSPPPGQADHTPASSRMAASAGRPLARASAMRPRITAALM